MLLYQAYQSQQAALTPLRWLANNVRAYADHPWARNNPLMSVITAACDVIADAKPHHDRPDFGIRSSFVNGQEYPVTEVEVLDLPFCSLLHFKKEHALPQPKVLLVAPMSGHFSTLLRGTVEALLQDHDVYITDWVNARNVPLWYGTFDFDDYVNYVMEFIRHLGPDVHVMAVCQPAVPVMAAVSLMAAHDDSHQPRSMILMGGPIDTRANPTKVNEFAKRQSLASLRRTVITHVPVPYQGMMRRVYPGFMQLSGFVSMNLDRHVKAHVDMFRNLVKGDGESAAATKKFYREYLTVMDMPAEFYLDTIHKVFHEHQLPRGELKVRGENVEPSAIRRTALMTVEGELDDICGLGQTRASHTLCSSLPEEMHTAYVQPGVGHYGVFNGRKFREEIMPRVTDFIRRHAG